MATLVIKHVPSELHDRLRARAKRNHRSVTKEAIALIDAGVTEHRAELASPVFGRSITADELDAALCDERFVQYRSIGDLNRYVDALRAERNDPVS